MVFSLSIKFQQETNTLLVTNLEFDTISELITVKAGQILSKKFFATKGGVSLDVVDITAEQQEKIEKPNVAVQTIDPVAINKLPSVGEPDLAQYLQVLPGVTFTGDQGGQLYIRGGLPIQNKVLLDGMVIYNPFHSIGLFSVFDNDIMRSADVYSAGLVRNMAEEHLLLWILQPVMEIKSFFLVKFLLLHLALN